MERRFETRCCFKGQVVNGVGKLHILVISYPNFSEVLIRGVVMMMMMMMMVVVMNFTKRKKRFSKVQLPLNSPSVLLSKMMKNYKITRSCFRCNRMSRLIIDGLAVLVICFKKLAVSVYLGLTSNDNVLRYSLKLIYNSSS